jgi:hypothetical protein
VDRPDDHVQFAAERVAVATDAAPPIQYWPGEADSALPQVRPPPATLAPVTASSTAASPHPVPSAAQAACWAAQPAGAVTP